MLAGSIHRDAQDEIIIPVGRKLVALVHLLPEVCWIAYQYFYSDRLVMEEATRSFVLSCHEVTFWSIVISEAMLRIFFFILQSSFAA
jgi:hypothetical protein